VFNLASKAEQAAVLQQAGQQYMTRRNEY